MKRYVDANKLKIEFMDLGLDHCQGTDGREAGQVIDDAATEDVAKIIHAHWSEETYECNGFGDAHFGFRCSNCGKIANRLEYCGNCGAIMDEETK